MAKLVNDSLVAGVVTASDTFIELPETRYMSGLAVPKLERLRFSVIKLGQRKNLTRFFKKGDVLDIPRIISSAKQSNDLGKGAIVFCL